MQCSTKLNVPVPTFSRRIALPNSFLLLPTEHSQVGNRRQMFGGPDFRTPPACRESSAIHGTGYNTRKKINLPDLAFYSPRFILNNPLHAVTRTRSKQRKY